MKTASFIYYGLIATVLIFVDRISKYWALSTCVHQKKILPGLSCKLSLNRGVAFGLFDNAQSAWAFYALTGVIIIIIGVLLAHTYKRICAQLSIAGEVLIISGAIGNIIDRFLHGAVIDFIALSYKTWTFPLFNCADAFIVAGVILLIIVEKQHHET